MLFKIFGHTRKHAEIMAEYNFETLKETSQIYIDRNYYITCFFSGLYYQIKETAFFNGTKCSKS